MSFLKKISDFLFGAKPTTQEAEAPYKLEASKVEQDPYTGFVITKEEDKVAAAAMTAKPKKAAKKAPKVKVEKVQTAPVVVAPKFKAVDLESKSKTELLEIARTHGQKVNARMGKAAIIAKLVK
jgi:fructose-1,6-bisphosphatase/sedoheptulose 1,7-bisphosphatase-like protein